MASPLSPLTLPQTSPSPEFALLVQKINNMPARIDAIMAMHTKAILQMVDHTQTYNRERIAKLQQQVDAQGKEIAELKTLVASLLPKPAMP